MEECAPFYSSGVRRGPNPRKVRLKLSVVIPVYNERATLKELLRRVVAVDIPKELVLVDDCSVDGSREPLAELEYDPNDYHSLIAPIVTGDADAVFGSRFAGTPRRVLYFWHSVMNKSLTTLSNIFTDLNLTDMETCYKVFRTECIRAINLEEDRFGFEPEVTAKLAKKGYRIYEVPVSYRGRTYAEGKKMGWKDGVRAVYAIVKYGVKARQE